MNNIDRHTYPIVTIVMPFYNVAKYIEQAINSVFQQDYPYIEFIAVDDCGNDNSRDIAETMRSKSPAHVDFKVVEHNQNKGLSAARNTGTKIAQGKYIYYLDSDDYMTPSCINLLVKKAEETGAELTVGGYQSIGADLHLGGILNTDVDVIEGNANIMEAYCSRKFYMMAWNKIVRTDFLRQNNLYFIEGIIHEDNPWSMQMAFCLNKVAFVQTPIYIYNIRPNSISTQTKLDKKRKSWAVGLSTYYKLLRKHKEYHDNRIVYDYIISETLCYIYFVANNFSINVLKQELERLNSFTYSSVLFSIKATGLPITHRLYNVMLISPVNIRLLIIKSLIIIKQILSKTN